MGSDDRSDDRGDAPQPPRRGQLPELRIFRFRGGPPGEEKREERPSPPDEPTAADHAADSDELEYIEDDTAAADAPEPTDVESERTGGTRPIRYQPPAAAPPATPATWETPVPAVGGTPPAPPPPPAFPATPAPAQRRRSRLPIVVGGVAMVVVLGILAWFLVGGLGGGDDESDSASSPKASDSAGHSAGIAPAPIDPAAWSERVCAAVNAWDAEIGDLPPKLNGLADEGGPALSESLADGYEVLTDAAQTLSGGLGSIEAPDVDGGRTAAQELTAMVEQVIDDVAQGRSDITELQDGEGPPPQDLVAELTVIVDTPSGTLREVVFNATPPLHEFFSATPDCAEYV